MSDPARRHRLLVLAVCCTSLLIAGLDVTAVNIALPAIGRDLNAPVSGLEWTIDGYTLAIAGFMLLAGSTADRLGRRRVFQTGLALFIGGSLACSLAPSLSWLVAFRVAQGLGASLLNPVALSIIADTFPDPRERARAIGLWGGTFGLSLALGPVLGGLLVASAGWRSVFWINLPIGLAAIALTAVLVPEARTAAARRPDLLGHALVVTVLAAVTYAIIEGSHHGYGSILIIALLVLAAAATAMLAGYEHRRDQPLLDRTFTGATLAAVAAFVALSGFLFLNTLYLQDARGYGVLHAGLLTAPMAAAAAIASPVSGRLTATHGPRTPMIAAGGLMAAAAVLLTSVAPATGLPVLLAAYVLFGVGFGLVNAPITHTAVSGSPHAQPDVSGAISSTGRQIGNCLGVAVLGSIVTAHGSSRGGFTAASHLGWWILAGCGALIAALGLLTAADAASAGVGDVAEVGDSRGEGHAVAQRCEQSRELGWPEGVTGGGEFVGRPPAPGQDAVLGVHGGQVADRLPAGAAGDEDVLVLADGHAAARVVVLPGAEQRAGDEIRPARLLAQFAPCALGWTLPGVQAAAGHRPVDADLLVVVAEKEDRVVGGEDDDAGGLAWGAVHAQTLAVGCG